MRAHQMNVFISFTELEVTEGHVRGWEVTLRVVAVTPADGVNGMA